MIILHSNFNIDITLPVWWLSRTCPAAPAADSPVPATRTTIDPGRNLKSGWSFKSYTLTSVVSMTAGLKSTKNKFQFNSIQFNSIQFNSMLSHLWILLVPFRLGVRFHPLDNGSSGLSVDTLNDAVVENGRVTIAVRLHDEIAGEKFFIVQMIHRE